MGVGRDDEPLGEYEALRMLVRNSTDMLARHTPDGTFLYVSPACEPLLGYAPEQLVGRSAYDFFHPDDLAAITASHEFVLETSDRSRVEYRFRRADGDYTWLETTSHTIRDGAGAVVEIHTSSRDMSQRKQAEARLAESEERFRLSMANAPIGKALVGPDGSWLEVNDRLCEILGRSRDELVETTFQDLTHVDDLDADLEYVQELLAGERDRYSMEKRYLHSDGHVVWCLLSVSLVRGEDGAPIHFISQIQDISERKRREQELRDVNVRLAASNAELERFALVASHDLRSPLAAAKSMLSLLPRVAGDLPDQAAEVLRRGTANVDRSLETVDALLELARFSEAPASKQAVDTDAVMEDLRDVLAQELEDSGATLHTGDLPTVVADPAQVRLVLQNLIGNAIKYREPGRSLRIEVAAHPVNGSWEFMVEDNGRGFAPEDREVMFEPFGRTSTGERIAGAGIGLATCRRIIEQHGGEIGAEPLDPGSRFTFTLPRADAEH